MTNKEALAHLKELSGHLDNVEFDDIIKILKESIRKIPIPLTKMPANTAIDRVRKNNGEALFSDVHNELSYIKDQNVIDNYLTEFGRANKPHEPMFYGSLESTLIGNQRVTALAETSVLYQDPNGRSIEGELYTISRWKNSSDLLLAEMVFSKEAIATNPDIKKAFEAQRGFAKQAGADDIEFYLEFLVFISEQFARPKSSHHDYKISTAYASLVMMHKDVKGVAFPSVQTKYQGQNLVLPPSVVDQFLRIDVLSVQRLYKNGKYLFLNNVKNCKTPNECLNKIEWQDAEAKDIATDEYIRSSLHL